MQKVVETCRLQALPGVGVLSVHLHGPYAAECTVASQIEELKGSGSRGVLPQPTSP